MQLLTFNEINIIQLLTFDEVNIIEFLTLNAVNIIQLLTFDEISIMQLFHISSKFDSFIGVEMVMCHALFCIKEIHQLLTW